MLKIKFKIILIRLKIQHLPHHDKNVYAKFVFRILSLVLYLLTSGVRKPQFKFFYCVCMGHLTLGGPAGKSPSGRCSAFIEA